MIVSEGNRTVYSVGEDGQDNAGNLDRERGESKGTDLGFLLWDLNQRGLPSETADVSK